MFGLCYFSHPNRIFFDINSIRWNFHSPVVCFFSVFCFRPRRYWFFFVYGYVVIWFHQSWNKNFFWYSYLSRASLLLPVFLLLGYMFWKSFSVEGAWISSNASLRSTHFFILMVSDLFVSLFDSANSASEVVQFCISTKTLFISVWLDFDIFYTFNFPTYSSIHR